MNTNLRLRCHPLGKLYSFTIPDTNDVDMLIESDVVGFFSPYSPPNQTKRGKNTFSGIDPIFINTQ